jgi:hypothetical protein
MDYEFWRYDLFGQSPDTNPMYADLMPETCDLPASITLNYIDRSLVDPEIHDLFTKPQIAIGLTLFYCNSCGDFPYCYIEGKDEARRVKSIENLQHLYSNFFERYCTAPVIDVGNDQSDGWFGHLCHMLWDIFVLHPGNATPPMIAAAVDVMATALRSSNDQCIVSALHGLGHWVSQVPAARHAIQGWLWSPTSENKAVLEYAKQAKTGYIQ